MFALFAVVAALPPLLCLILVPQLRSKLRLCSWRSQGNLPPLLTQLPHDLIATILLKVDQPRHLLAAGRSCRTLHHVLHEPCLRGGWLCRHRPGRELCMAARAGQADVVRFLVKTRKVSMDQACARGLGPLHLACERGSAEVVRTLLEGCSALEANRRDRGYHGYTPLHTAMHYGYADVVRVILEDGRADVNALRTHNDTTPLHLSWRTTPEVIRALVAAGANLEAHNLFEATPLLVACFRGKHAAALALIEAGANVYEVDVNGRTALELARAKGHTDVVELLMAKMATAAAS